MEPKHRQGVLFIVSIDVIVLELCLSVENDMQALWMSTNITLVQSLCEVCRAIALEKLIFEKCTVCKRFSFLSCASRQRKEVS